MTSFKELGLSAETLKVLEEMGFEKPTEIQAQGIPQLLHGESDFIGMAQTGTGKTGAFGIPLIERIDTSTQTTQALILAPTRELGQQICAQLEDFSRYHHKVNVLAVYGGAAIQGQIKSLKKVQHIIVATPGRLRDLIRRKRVDLENLRFLVLDEADEMLRMGFREEIDEILLTTPSTKLTWLFSATMPSEIRRIVHTYMRDPIEIRINEGDKVNVNIEHQYVTVRQSEKLDALTRFFDVQGDLRGLVFCRTKMNTQELAEKLVQRGYQVDALHGDLSQRQRDRVMNRFKANTLQSVIATDVAARGIDVDDLTHVFHFNLPDDSSQYTHRSGRTARAGKKGISMALVTESESHKIRRFNKELGISFAKGRVPSKSEIAELRIEKWCAKIANKDTKGRVDREIIEKAYALFERLSKEELIEQIVKDQLEKLFLDRGNVSDIKEPKSRRRGHDSKRSGGNHRKFNKPKGKKKPFRKRYN